MAKTVDEKLDNILEEITEIKDEIESLKLHLDVTGDIADIKKALEKLINTSKAKKAKSGKKT